MAKKKIQNVLTMDAINEIYAEYEKVEEYTFKDLKTEKDYKITIDKSFRLTKMDIMLDEFRENIKREIENEEIISPNHRTYLVFILIMKTFTNIPIPDGLNSSQLITLFEKFVDMGLYEFVFDKLGQDRIDWLTEKMLKASKSAEEIDLNLKELMDKMPSEVKEILSDGV